MRNSVLTIVASMGLTAIGANSFADWPDAASRAPNRNRMLQTETDEDTDDSLRGRIAPTSARGRLASRIASLNAVLGNEVEHVVERDVDGEVRAHARAVTMLLDFRLAREADNAARRKLAQAAREGLGEQITAVDAETTPQGDEVLFVRLSMDDLDDRRLPRAGRPSRGATRALR